MTLYCSSASANNRAGGARVLVKSQEGQSLSIFISTEVEADTLVTMPMMLAAQEAALVRLSETEAEQEGVPAAMNWEMRDIEATKVNMSMV
eukprot:CAMPEP_0206445322 /NCGR_PEP_ID=MMETSP0324_2-20121206/15440_1 /ASSEMBLY_ACC=CAM_ASM_000836 /TAXON_ID=2866 /ORGANISM="Crypthecodinium cohnii, Strain Seligo" /LENGTH=90 /DNA_ID=CAMNT_0053913517 /DNA_START=432 /DNA_END=701 /DNA_ORIENTATION=+